MRIGLLIAGSRRASDAMSLARTAEQAGIAEIWISEDPSENGAFVVAGAIAGATAQAKVGLGVINPWLRHPMLIAMEFASLRELAPGRTILALGASNPGWIQERCGVPFRAPVAVLREATQIIRAGLDGERVDFAGQHFTVGAKLNHEQTEPAQIRLGVKGSQMITMAAKHADGIILSVMSSPRYVRWVRDKLPAGTDVSAYVVALCGPQARSQALRPLAKYLGIQGIRDITLQGGLDPEAAEYFRESWLSGRNAERYITDEMIDTFTVAGDLDACIVGLDRLARAGLDAAVLLDPGDDRVEDLLRLANAYQQRHAGKGR